ncbi:MAG: hypothetical protein AAGA55_10825 [Planctomycetota bacterium]
MSKPMADAIKAFLSAARTTHGAPQEDPSSHFRRDHEDPIVAEVVYSLLLWESDHQRACRGFEAIEKTLTGLNELRVCDADEIAAMLPRDTPGRQDRAARLVAILNDIFAREHALTLASLAGAPKREARQYLDGLQGMPPFVAARVALIAIGGHAVPADDRIAGVLAKHGVIEDLTLSNAELISQLERAVRASDAPEAYALLECEAATLKTSRRASRPKPRSPKKSAAKRGRNSKAEP